MKLLNPYDFRDPCAGVGAQFVERWSPRAFAERPLALDTLNRIFDAARWSPSCFNEQPWRFHTTLRDGEGRFDAFAALLNDSNRSWAQHAGLIGFLSGRRCFSHNGKPNQSYAFDCGAAWLAMSLQAQQEGLSSHAMAGIDVEAANRYFDLDPAQETVLIGFVIGYPGSREQLAEPLREREQPSPRKPLAALWNHY